MTHSNLGFFLELKNEEQSILQIAENLCHCIREITLAKSVFNEVRFLQKKDEISLDFTDENFVKILADNILSYSLKDIKQFDKIESADINYSRPFGFDFALIFRSKNSALCLNFVLGGNSGNRIGLISNKSKTNESYDWYSTVLKSFVNNLDVDYGVVRPNDMEYLDICYDNHQYSLGWITYFSNDYKIDIPTTLNDIEYESVDNGKYLISTKDNFGNNFEENREKLLSLMKEIAERVPEYSK
jgi:hypothetical protein